MFSSKAKSSQALRRPTVVAVDLFCGAGGLTKGLANAGIDVRLGIDCDPACEYPYTANNKAEFRLKSVEKVTVELLESYYSENAVRLLAGCAPCQTFSTYYQKYVPQASEDDKRWSLLLQFSRLACKVRPELVTMENVPGLEKQPVFTKFVNSLKKAGYKVSHSIVHCEDYGIPQHRSRLVLLASRLGEIELLTPEELHIRKRTVRQAIGQMPEIEAGGCDEKDPLHMSSELSPINLRRIRSSTPGGTWRDWPKNLVAQCHQKKSGKTYPSVYGRMEWDKASPTITTQFFGFGNGRFGHPEQDRALSLREGAILQSFPRRYRFSPPGEPVCLKSIGRMIGNAVLRPLLACLWIAEYKAMPPTEFSRLFEALELDSGIRNEIDRLLMQKHSAKEKELTEIAPELANWAKQTFEHCDGLAKTFPTTEKSGWELLNHLFLKFGGFDNR